MSPPPPQPQPQPPPHHHTTTTSTTTSPQTLQFLSNLLSQRGPTSLPYTEDVKWLIRQHLLSLTSLHPSLHPKSAAFTHNDGRTVHLLQADGTIPMLYQSQTYNIPIIIWLMELYPRQPPLVFVNPTKDMIIKRPHQFVTPNGLVNVPYLQKWVYPSSNLVDLVRELSLLFGRDPPLYSQRKPDSNPSTNPNSNLSTNPNSNSGSITNPNSGFGNLSNSGGGYLSGRVFPPSPYVGSGRISTNDSNSYVGSGRIMSNRTDDPNPYVGSGRISTNRTDDPNPYVGSGRISMNRTDDPSEVYKKNAMNKLVEMVHGDVVGLRKTREAEMESLFSAQAVLRQREGEINCGMKELVDEKEGLEQQLQLVLTNADVLEGWLRENEEKMEKVKSNVVDVEDAFEPIDGLSKQMLESSASDLAIEDVIYSLDKAVQDGVVPFDQYLRNVRLLSREQFLHRATAAKVRAAQMQAHVASMASRASQYAL